jgi:predicted ATPase/class 3 adenylate cyclase
MRSDLPSGTVTFVFTDVEGSTKLLSELGEKAYADALAGHRQVIREACSAEGGIEVDTQGDAFFFAFATAPAALAAVGAFTEGFSSEGPIGVRVGIHTGTPLVGEEGYVGHDVHRAARIAASGHGGQVLVSASTASLVESELTDLGEHRLKDLEAPERIFQLGVTEFPPLRSLHATRLPVPATPFLGRKRELGDVLDLLSDPDARLVTLTGPGGTGKTRLVLQAAAEASDGFPDGVYWAPLAPLREPSLLEATLAQALEVSEQPGVSVIDTVVTSFASKHSLLVLDNCEHLADPVAALIRTLLDGCPSLVVAASSRERLGLRSERVYPVASMDASEGELLFIERALAVAPEFVPDEQVAAICEAVDRLPLAIELAAARVRSLSTLAIRERLSERLSLLSSRDRDLEERQRTLEATIGWSYDLLDTDEQRVLQALSVFAGGCTLDAAEEIAGADLDLLESLLDKSLLRHRVDEAGQDRYWLLQTIRVFAAERLDDDGGDGALRERHADWYCAFAERHGRVPRHRFLHEGFGPMRSDYDNIRSALSWAWASGRPELGLRFGACGRFWNRNALYHDAVSWLEHASSAMEDASPAIKFNALAEAGMIAFFVQSDVDRAEESWAEALRLAEVVGGDEDVVELERMLAGVAVERGDLEHALEINEGVLSHWRATGDRRREATTLHVVGNVLRDLGRLDESETALREAVTISRELDDAPELANALHSLGDLSLERHEPGRAIDVYLESLELHRRQARGGREPTSCLAGIAAALAERGEDEDAAALWGAVGAAETALGFRMIGHERRRYERRLAQLENTTAWSEGNSLTLDQAVQRVHDLIPTPDHY